MVVTTGFSGAKQKPLLQLLPAARFGPASLHAPPGVCESPTGTISAAENDFAPGTLFLNPAQLPLRSFHAENECDPLTATFSTPSPPAGSAEPFLPTMST